MPSNALSKLSQKLISCDAVPDDTSRVSLVTAWMDLIHVLTCACSALRNVLSLSVLTGTLDMFGRVFATWACSTARWMTGWMMSCVSGISTFCCRWRRESSSSANFFFVMGIPMEGELCKVDRSSVMYNHVPIFPSPSLPPPRAPTKASNQGFTAPLTRE